MRIGLALGSGGLRGVAHIGVLEVLEEVGIFPEMMAGTSSGSLIAALYANGMTTQEMRRLALKVKPSDIFEPIHTSTIKLIAPALLFLLGISRNLASGIICGDRLERFVAKLIGNTKKMSDLKKFCAIIAVDVNSGAKIIFSPTRNRSFKGTHYYDACVKDAVRASCSIPGVFRWKEWNGRYLVDGAIREPVPAKALKELGADFVIGVNIGHTGECDRKAENIIDNVSQSLEILGEEISDYVLDIYADVVINPNLFSLPLNMFEKIPYMIEAGRKAAKNALPVIFAKMRKAGINIEK